MTGIKDYNYPAFYKAEERLVKAGYTVINPANLNKAGDLWSDCLRNDLKHIVKFCSGIALLDTWFISRGARLELSTALQLGMYVISAKTLKLLDIKGSLEFKVRHGGKYVARYRG